MHIEWEWGRLALRPKNVVWVQSWQNVCHISPFHLLSLVTCLCSLRPCLGITSSRKPHLIHFMPQIRHLCSHNVTEPSMDPLAQCIVKHIYRYRAVVKESTGIGCKALNVGPSKDSRQLTNPPVVFREGWDRGVCDQFTYILLTDWWWGNGGVWESTPSTFCFLLIWGWHAGGQHIVNFFLLVQVLVSAKQLKDMTQNIVCSSWGGTKGPWLCFIDKLLFCLTCLCFCIFSLLWLNLLFGSWGIPRRLKLFYKQEAGDTRDLSLGRPHRVLLGFNNSSF